MLKQRILDSLFGAFSEGDPFNPEKALVLAVSGGVDSLSLVHALRDSGLKLIVTHLDHALRDVSAQQAQALGEMMTRWGLPYVSQRVDVAAFARAEKLGIEEAARICRYRFLFEVAREHDAQALVLGHNADDQVETVLMHFMRGAGMAGLAGMARRSVLPQFDAKIPLLRPLLGISRAEIEQYAQQHQLEVLLDETNVEPVYYRNQLRLSLIPEMERLNFGFKQSVLRAAKVLRVDNLLLEKLEAQAFRQVVDWQSENEIVLNREAFLQLDLALQRRVVRRGLNALRPVNPDFGFEDIEKTRQVIINGPGAQDLSQKTRAVMVGNTCHLLEQGALPTILSMPQLNSDSTLELGVGESVFLNPGWQLSASLISKQDYAKISDAEKQDPYHAWLNPAGMALPLIVRVMQTGERWAPLGLECGSQKLSDFYVNNKIPQAARAKWPVVLSGESVVWVVGLRIAHDWRLQGDENEILHLSLKHKD